ncbi:MAG: hypothetical protein WA066_03965, partial [Candidatus Omnitrophota bacterium]
CGQKVTLYIIFGTNLAREWLSKTRIFLLILIPSLIIILINKVRFALGSYERGLGVLTHITYASL